MGSLSWIYRSFLLRGFRDRFELFWNLAFPLLLMTILILIFGNVTQPGSIRFNVALINFQEHVGEEGFAVYLQEALEDMAREEDPWLTLLQPEEGQDPVLFKEEQLQALEEGGIHALMVIPAHFEEEVMAGLMASFRSQEVVEPGLVHIYSRPHNQSSNIAAGILEQVVAGFNREFSRELGLVEEEKLLILQERMVDIQQPRGVAFSYVDYIVPGIILASFLFSCLSTVSEGLTAPRDRGVLRRYFATPLSPVNFSLGLFLYILTIAIIQLFLISIYGRTVFGVEISLFIPMALFFLAYGVLVLMAVGLFIASVASSANAASTLTNIVTYPMMFLGGLYFPVHDMPWPLQGIVLVNPVTYLSNGLREALGVMPSPTSFWMNLLIPGVWLLISAIYGLKRFRWEVE